jgi:hypothetical protein
MGGAVRRLRRMEHHRRGAGDGSGAATGGAGPTAEARRPRRRRGTAAADADGIDEFDRVLGGGLVPGSAVLVGGDPGIGKSTLLLQAAARAAGAGGVVYVSGEEAEAQIRMRAGRLGLGEAPWDSRRRRISATSSPRSRRSGRGSRSSTRSRRCGTRGWRAPRARWRRCAPRPMPSSHSPSGGERRWCWWGTSPRRGRSPGRGSSSTWSTPCSTSRASAGTSSASCAR